MPLPSNAVSCSVGRKVLDGYEMQVVYKTSQEAYDAAQYLCDVDKITKQLEETVAKMPSFQEMEDQLNSLKTASEVSLRLQELTQKARAGDFDALLDVLKTFGLEPCQKCLHVKEHCKCQPEAKPAIERYVLPEGPGVHKYLGGLYLQDFYRVEIRTETLNNHTRKSVYFHSNIHKNMPVKLTFCFSTDWTNYAILRDYSVLSKWVEHFGPDTFK